MKRLQLVSLLAALSILSSCVFWAASGSHIHNKNDGNVGIGTANPDSKLTVVEDETAPVRNYSGISSTISSPSEARAVYGAAINPNSTFNYGGYFTSAGNSSGLFGEASDTSAGIAGGVFHSHGANGRGVIGMALNTDDVRNYGGYFHAQGKQGVGLWAKGGANGYAAVFPGNVRIIPPNVSTALFVDGKGGIGGTLATELKGGLGVKGGALISSTQGYAIWAIADGIAKAGLFQGDVRVSGNLTKGGGGFVIDHPLDPENKYLYHSYVESPDMMNVYNGNAKLDRKGQAIVKLPSYFEALNRDFRYQLTAIGAPAPNLHVARTISDNTFIIAGGKPGMDVSWQVTGIRNDAFANSHRIVSEVDKEQNNQGKYLHPKELNKPENLAMHYYKRPRIAETGEKSNATASLD